MILVAYIVGTVLAIAITAVVLVVAGYLGYTLSPLWVFVSACLLIILVGKAGK